MLSTIQSRTFVFSYAVWKYRHWNIQNDNFACGSVWVWNLVSDIKVGTYTEGLWEKGAVEGIQTE
jgi:hypothetical protein